MGSAAGGTIKQDEALIDTTVNACKIYSAGSSNFIIKMILEKAQRCSNITFRCPFKKVENFRDFPFQLTAFHRFSGLIHSDQLSNGRKWVPIIHFQEQIAVCVCGCSRSYSEHRINCRSFKFQVNLSAWVNLNYWVK